MITKAFTQAQIEAFARGEGFYFRRWDWLIDPKQTPIASLFAPDFFKPVARDLNRHDIIRIHTADGSIDFDLTVRSKKNEEIVVRLRPRISQEVIDAAEEAERSAGTPTPLKAIAAA